MQNSNNSIWPGSRVKVFDPQLFVDDIKTPLSHTCRPATVVRRYGKLMKRYGGDFWLGPYPDCIDVVFDHRPHKVSKGHFTSYVEMLEETPCS